MEDSNNLRHVHSDIRAGHIPNPRLQHGALRLCRCISRNGHVAFNDVRCIRLYHITDYSSDAIPGRRHGRGHRPYTLHLLCGGQNF